jgi:hypothetical protein
VLLLAVLLLLLLLVLLLVLILVVLLLVLLLALLLGLVVRRLVAMPRHAMRTSTDTIGEGGARSPVSSWSLPEATTICGSVDLCALPL